MKVIKDYINLLPGGVKKPSSEITWSMSRGAVIALALVLAWGVVISLEVWQGARLKKQLAPLLAKRQALQRELEVVQKEQGLTVTSGMGQEKAALVNRLLGDRVLWSEVFKQFSLLVPKGLWFDSLEGTSVGKAEIRLRGGSLNYVSVAEFMLAMEKSGYFEKPQLMFAQKSMVQGQEVVGFEIVSGIRKGGAQ